MRQFYSIIMFLCTPFLLLRLWWKGRVFPAYRQRIAERFALIPVQKTDLWIHAVSLGEVVAATPLIEAFLAKNWQVCVTTMTPTGSERVRKHFANRVSHQYIPYDLPWILTRFFNKLSPRLGLVMETELWPNMIFVAAAANIPLFLINARISDKAFPQYEKIAFFLRPFLRKFHGIYAQSGQDAQRFINLGAAADKVQVMGNLKFVGQSNGGDAYKFLPLKERWGKDRKVFLIASTHKDEEAQILAQIKKLQAALPNIIVLIAPRHPERFQEVYQLSIDAGFATGLRSNPASLTAEKELIILDSLGELFNFYFLSDYAFVGGSLVPIGGHNVLEPMAAKIPVFCGSHMQNSKNMVEDLLAAQALIMVSNAEELIKSIIAVDKDAALKTALITNAQKILEKNQGVLQQYVTLFTNYL